METQPQASNPARLPSSFVQYLRCYPGMLLLPVGGILFALVLGTLKGISIGVCVVLGIAIAVISLPTIVGNMKRQLRDGNLCAAIVVNTSPYTVAVLTDLCNDRSEPRLAIKIKTAPLEKMAGGPPKLGEKLAAASLYFGATVAGEWQDFNPMIVRCACTNLQQIKNAVESIDPNDWTILAQAMKSLKATALGLHRIQI